MSDDEVIGIIFEELKKAEQKHPGWPDDKIHCATIICEEAGELIQAAIDFAYNDSNSKDFMKHEAAQVGAMAIRFLKNITEARLSVEVLICIISEELTKAKQRYPEWPDDKIHAAAIVNKEAGELIQTAIDYENADENSAIDRGAKLLINKKMKEKAKQTFAMAIRFLKNL